VESLINIVSGFGIVASVGVAIYLFFEAKKKDTTQTILHLPREINETELGKLEGSIAQLKEIVIIAHQIEEPTDILLKAVKINFSRKVKYRFFISPCNYNEEKETSFNIFKGFAQIAVRNLSESSNGNNNIDNLLEINSLHIDWEDCPYIFYRIENGFNGEAKYHTFGYRGAELKEGIAKNYCLIEPELAHTVLRTVIESYNVIIQNIGNSVESGEFDYKNEINIDDKILESSVVN
jgi:hypothetical protein